MWGSVIGLLTGIVGGVSDNAMKKKEIKDAKHAREITRISNNEESDGKADLASIKRRTWGDEYLLMLTTSPLLFLFFEPVYVAVFGSNGYSDGAIRLGVIEGFEALKLMPEYVWYGIAGVYIDVLGFRRMMRIVIEKMVEKRLK